MVEVAVPEQPKSPRYQAWVGLFVFSLVSLIAHASTLPDKRSGPEKWVLAVLSISLAFSFLGVLAHYVKPDMFVGEKAEGGVASLLLVFWVAGLPAVMKPRNCIAICIGGIHNTNLYFSSWAALACSLYIWGHYGQELAGQDYTGDVLSKPETTKWYALLASSVVVIASAAQFHISFCGSGSTCSRNAWAVALGCVAAVASAGIVFISTRNQLNNLIELTTSGVLVIMYIFGVAFITFGKGSGVEIGNLYFSVWAGFVISGMLANASFKQFTGKMAETQEAEAHAAPAPTLEVIDNDGKPEAPLEDKA